MARGKKLTEQQKRTLAVLRDHLFLSRRQLELYLGCSGRTARRYLLDLLKKGWIQRVNAHQPWMHTRSLAMLTPTGIEALARDAGIPTDMSAWQTAAWQARLDHLALLMERVFQLRTVFLWLQRPATAWNWKADTWDVEVEKLFSAKNKTFSIPFHGAALMRRTDNRWAFVVVEFDTRRTPVQRDRERWVRFILAQDDARYWAKDKEELFPILVLIAQDEFRLQDYYSLLRSVALARQMPMPRAYLTTISEALTLRKDVTRPIWYSTISGRRTSLLFDTEGIPIPLPSDVPWRKIESTNNRAITPIFLTRASSAKASEAAQQKNHKTVNDLATLALTLEPLDRRLLDEIANHPLLMAEELGLVLRLTEWRVEVSLRRLSQANLIESYLPPADENATAAHESSQKEETVAEPHYLLATDGVRYLALISGFGASVKRYMRARGWGNGFEGLVRHWQHTHEGNAFFLQLAQTARKRGHKLLWMSELESRLYYEYGKRRHSFLPDGRGTYVVGRERYEFALEIDRSRASQSKLTRKLNEYLACVNSNVLRGEGIELLRLLVVTNSWERAETIRRIAWKEVKELKSDDILPIFITTFDRLRASGADGAIWLRVSGIPAPDSALTESKGYCFACFTPKSAPKR
jgi:DNA-binding MarR family transcriptional regulator